MPEKRAPANRTLVLSDAERAKYRARLLKLRRPVTLADITDTTVCQDIAETAPYLPENFVDLLFLDPPYNLTKSFGGLTFNRMKPGDYAALLDQWLGLLRRTLKPQASVYICGTWETSASIQNVAGKYFKLRSRITWEREKGRGQQRNWKNSAEDIWFYTCGDDYKFHTDRVRLKRRVLAPYTEAGLPKGWRRETSGNYRLTAPSNLWTDITVPFWSMPENTDHPAQKPEKLLAKIILASSDEGDMVFDPFLGSGTAAVVARKLGRRYLGIEIDETYACLAEKRLSLAAGKPRIQGYEDGVFWERNSRRLQEREQ